VIPVIAGCFADNNIIVKNTRPELIENLIDILRKMGVKIKIKGSDIIVSPNKRMSPIKVETMPYPGFPTDLQAQLMALLTQTDGVSQIKESIFNNRFNHANELNKMGANIVLSKDIAQITGITQFKGNKTVYATDLRASAALVLGALIADGETIIDNAAQLFRGYEELPQKLSKLGADIEIIY